jgi:hypothetical protein
MKREEARMARWTVVGIVAVCAVLGGLIAAPSHVAASASRQTATLTFTQSAPGRSSGAKLLIDYVNPDDPSAKPPAVRRVATRLRIGSRVDTDVPAKCGASDAELMAEGASACPDASRVGTGLITIDTGFPEPGRFITADVVFLNNTDELIFLSTIRGSGAKVVTRSRLVDGHVLVANAPMLPGTPPDGGAIDTVKVRLKSVQREIGGVRHAYIATPPRCPASGEWINRMRFTYADSVTQVTTNPSACAA